jgi:uncharacterized membrane protein
MNPEVIILNGVVLFLFLVLFIISFLFYKYPPKKINGLYGYRTYQSMQNQENWDFANAISSKFMLKSTILSFILALIFQNTTSIFIDYKILIILGIYIIPVILVIHYTEYHLNKLNKTKEEETINN